MKTLIDFTNCESGWLGYGGSEIKHSVIYDGKRYMLKFPKNIREERGLNTSYSNNIFSEYVACNIIKTTGIAVQNTLLGIFKDKQVVACEDFTDDNFKLQEFDTMQNSYIDANSPNKNPNLEEIYPILKNHERLKDISEIAIKSFWDTFVLDALLGNFDRHGKNWGYLVDSKNKITKLAPIYDCGCCLYPRIADEHLHDILNDKSEIEKRIYTFPKAAIKYKDEKIDYFYFINQVNNPDCNAAVLRIVPKINFDKIDKVIYETPGMSDKRKDFMSIMVKNRFNCLLKNQYKKLILSAAQGINNNVKRKI